MNARKELLDFLGGDKVKCANIIRDYFSTDEKRILLKVGYSDEDWEKFLSELDFDYDIHTGCLGFEDELSGTVWLMDGSWLTRIEHDEMGFWTLHYPPEIPADLQ